MNEEKLRNEFLYYLEDMPRKYRDIAVKAMDKMIHRYELQPKETALALVGDDNGMILADIFLKVMSTTGKSSLTIYNYGLTLKRFFQTIPKVPKDITSIDIIMYLTNYRETRNVASTTMNNIHVCLSSFFSWARKVGYIEKNPMDLVDKFKMPKRQREYLTDKELEELRYRAVTLKEKALIEFLASTACRIAELTNIRVCDVDWKNNTIDIIGKGNKERTVTITPKAAIALNEYLSSRGYGLMVKPENLSRREIALQNRIKKGKVLPLDKRTSKEYLFECKHTKANPDGKPDEHKLRDTFEGVVARTSFGSKRWITPHTMRHTWATLARRKGMSIEDISTYLGHENIATTMIYVAIDQSKIHDDVLRYAI